MKELRYVKLTETKIPPAGVAIVSFELSCDGWCKLRKSKKWKKFLKRAEEIEKIESQKPQQESQDLSAWGQNMCGPYPQPQCCPSQPQEKERTHKIFRRSKC